MTLIHRDQLLLGTIGWEFVGEVHGQGEVSFILVDAGPGEGPASHLHPYQEVIIVLEGEVTAVVSDAQVTATGGQVLVIPANTPHHFINSGTTRLRQVDIHASGHFITTWLEPDFKEDCGSIAGG